MLESDTCGLFERAKLLQATVVHCCLRGEPGKCQGIPAAGRLPPSGALGVGLSLGGKQGGQCAYLCSCLAAVPSPIRLG